MAVKVLELHHHGIRVGPSPADVKKAYGFYHDVLGLDATELLRGAPARSTPAR